MARRTVLLPPLMVAVLLLACAAVLLLAVPKEAEATFPGQNGKIAYHNADTTIYTVNPNGSGKTKVTEPCNYPSLPDYSPTGKKITYEDCEGKPRHY